MSELKELGVTEQMTDPPNPVVFDTGIDLRDYFAAKAMAALIMEPGSVNNSPEIVSRWAYKYADKMLAERIK